MRGTIKREELKAMDAFTLIGTDFYDKSEADKVMDAMEARIKELESQLENVQNTMYTDNVDLGMENHKLKERIKELEADVIGYKASLERANFKMCEKDACIKELEAENERLKEQVASAKILVDAANEHLESYKNKLAARTTPKAVSDTIVELREENARLKAQVPKWHDVSKPLYTEDGKDYYDLPGESGEYVVVYFDGQESVDRYDIDFGWDSNLEQDVYSMWCELPTAPTEKENG